MQEIVGERTTWAEQLEQVKRLRQVVLDTEKILDHTGQKLAEVSNATVATSLDTWRQQLAERLTSGTLGSLEQECLTEFARVLSNLRPYLVHCYDQPVFPRTNNDMERSIRRLKTLYRRISGRKNWNNYLLRYGRCVAFYEWWQQDEALRQQFAQRVRHLDRTHWHQMRHEAKSVQHEQLSRFRFRRRRDKYLASLEEIWASATTT